MIRHPFSLERLAIEYHSLLRGAILSEVFLKDHDELVLCWEKGREQWDMECHLREPYISVIVRAHQGRPRNNTRDVFELALGSVVSRVVHCAPDRILRIDCRRLTLHIQLFGGSNANVVLLNADEYVIDAVRERRTLLAKEFSLKPMQPVTIPDTGSVATVYEWLKRSQPQLGSFYSIELLRRLDLAPNSTATALSDTLQQKIAELALEIATECRNSSKTYLLRADDGSEVMSLIPLVGYNKEQEFESVREAVQWRVIHLHRDLKRSTSIEQLRGIFRKEAQRLNKALSHMREASNNTERQTTLQYAADLLLSQPTVHTSGRSTIVVEGWQGEELRIDLDPRLNLAENAQVFYDKARRSREARRVNLERQPPMEARLALMNSLLEELDREPTEDRLRALSTRYGPRMKNQDAQPKGRDESAYRRFDLGGGYVLYVGRSAQNNDELTMRFAKQNDLWFHARGVSGSHAVLRCSDSGKVPKNIVEQSASIAAYYSKSRNAKYTPVVYTQRKYVRKPKGANVGAVTLEREEVIMVEPKLPPGAKDDGE